jgi:four helix bundle protein
MQNPDRLRVTAEARSLAVCVYELTARFPAEERYGLVAQMRRAAVSVGSTIAEGCGRRGNGELLHYLYMASGSASELAFQLTVAEALGLGLKESREKVGTQVNRLQRMLNRLTARLAPNRRPDREE